jgi:hypothetical protein
MQRDGKCTAGRIQHRVAAELLGFGLGQQREIRLNHIKKELSPFPINKYSLA